MTPQKIFQAILFGLLGCLHLLSLAQKPLEGGEHFAPVNGLQIHYYVSGKGPVCLFPSPGWGASVNLYKNTLKPFEELFTMVYYDTRLSGKSTGPEDSTKYTSQHFIDDMDAIRVYLRQPKVWVMGHSSGGYQILNYGIQHSDKLNGIVVLNGGACMDSLSRQIQPQSIAKRMENVRKTKGQAYFEKYYARAEGLLSGKDTTKYNASERLEVLFPFYFHDEDKVKNFPQPEKGDSVSGKARRFTRISNFGNEDLCPQLDKIRVPTLVVTGDDDVATDKATQSDIIAKSIPSSTKIVIKNAGHFPWIEQPTEFFSQCTKWLKQRKVKNNK